jgi:hypothetical protein
VIEHNEYEEAFSERGFREKLKTYAKSAGKEVVEKALLLYYAAQEEKAPKWAKATIAGALGYFIVPMTWECWSWPSPRSQPISTMMSGPKRRRG